MFDWEGFKRTEFAVKVEENKEKFFSDCKANGVHVFLGEFAKKSTVYICALRYKTEFSSGRYELFALKGWEIQPGRLYGVSGLPEFDYDKLA